jgi:hypothetical protein
MKATPHIFAILLTVPALHANMIDVSLSQTIVVSRGDTLSFELFTGSYRSAAQKFGLSLDPDVLRFALITAPLAPGPEVSVTLRSVDSSLFVPLGAPLDFTAGYYASDGFQGNVSTLQGQFALNKHASQNLLESGSIWLDFTNHVAGFTLGLEPLPVSRDLWVSLSGGPLSVGANNGAVLLGHPVRPGAAKLAAAAAPGALTNTPEPASMWTMFSGGGLLFAFSGALRRFSRI